MRWFLKIYSWNKSLHVSDSSSVHHQEIFTVNTAMVYVIQVCWQQAVSKRLWHLTLLCVQWKSPDDGQRNCPKHVEFYSICHTGLLTACCQETCMTYTIAVCTVKNAWWWTEELSETCRVLWYMSYRFADSLLSGNLYDIYHCCVYSEKLLMMDRGTLRNM
jgi:hypothetical protein